MESVLPLSNFNIRLFLRSLSIDDLDEMFPASTFLKGREYYDDGHVKSVHYENQGEILVGQVQGTRRYQVKVSVSDGELRESCTCPL